MHPKYVTGALVLGLLIFPVFIVQFTLMDETAEPSQYMCKVKILHKLDETLEGTYQYYMVQLLEGEGPADEFVILIDKWTIQRHDQLDLALLAPNFEFWGLGRLMTPEVWVGDQYLFFDLPQLYLLQVKGRLFWPDQVIELRFLYQAPLRALDLPTGRGHRAHASHSAPPRARRSCSLGLESP